MLLLVLDLDHTLIHSHRKCLDPDLPGFSVRMADGDRFHVHVRPHALELLEFLIRAAERRYLRVGVWTAATFEYAEAVVSGLFRLVGVTEWHRHLAIFRTREDTRSAADGHFIKDLDRVRDTPDVTDVILVDDDPSHEDGHGNDGNVMQAPRFVAGPVATRLDRFLCDLRLSLERVFASMAKASVLTPVLRPSPVRPVPGRPVPTRSPPVPVPPLLLSSVLPSVIEAKEPPPLLTRSMPARAPPGLLTEAGQTTSALRTSPLRPPPLPPWRARPRLGGRPATACPRGRLRTHRRSRALADLPR